MFDLVNHTILLQKLSVYLQNSSTVSLLKSYLQDRAQCIFLNGNYLTKGVVKCEVPHGSVLVHFYSVFSLMTYPYIYLIPKLYVVFFADDNSIHSHGTNVKSVQRSLQEGLNDVSKWCDQNRMVVHPGKTKSMVLVSRQKHQLKPLILNLTLGTNITEQVREHRVLEITSDEELKWQPHIDNICKHVARNLFLLGQLRKYVDIGCRKLFFNAHLMAHINYASTVWSSSSEVHLKKTQLPPQTSSKTLSPDHSLSTTAKLKKLDILPLMNNLCTTQLCLCLKSIWVGRLSMYATFLTKRLLDMSKKKLCLTAHSHWPIWVLRSLGHLSGTLSLRKWKRTGLCVASRYVFVRSWLTNETVFRGICGITMFVKLLCLYIYCFCFHYW